LGAESEERIGNTALQRLFIGVRAVAGTRAATAGPAHARMVAEADGLPYSITTHDCQTERGRCGERERTLVTALEWAHMLT
jgi:hypothetical protein